MEGHEYDKSTLYGILNSFMKTFFKCNRAEEMGHELKSAF